MGVFLPSLAFFLAMAAHSGLESADAAYCVCTSGGEAVFQKNIDYACGSGADCSAILQNGPCFNPNTVKDHCNYAVNSYYQRKGQATGSCDFAGSAAVSSSSPSAVSGSCVYPSSPSNLGSTTPSTNPIVGGNTNGSGGVITGSLTPPGIGLAPGSGFSSDSSSANAKAPPPHSLAKATFFFMLFSVTVLMAPRI